MSSLFTAIAKLISLYSTIIWIRVLLTWLPSQRYTYQNDGPIITVIKKMCDPFLNLFKLNGTRTANIDFSPLLALMSLNVLQSIFMILAQSGVISIGLVVALIVRGLWQYFVSFIFVLLIIALGVRYFCAKSTSPKCQAFVRFIDPILTKPVNFIAKIIYPKKTVTDQTYVLTAFIAYAVLYLIIKYSLQYLIAYLIKV